MNPGGKGADQAVAAARLGADVIFISKLGNDIFGKLFASLFRNEGIDTGFLLSDEELPGGVAFITVDRQGENSIVVASGADAGLSVAGLKAALPAIKDAGILLMQLEILASVVEYLAAYAAAHHVKVILNPAPAAPLSAALLQQVELLTPNESEASLIAGIPLHSLDDAERAARIIHGKGVRQVIITLGAKGALIYNGVECRMVEARKVTPVDTTAAGDVFNGAVAAALAEGEELYNAVRFACDAAAISVTRMGAQSSVPYRKELHA